jgi:hypothetical protein
MKKAITLAALALALVGNAQAGTSLRWHVAPGWTLTSALRSTVTQLDNAGPVTGASCQATDGNASAGRAHIVCVGNYNYDGTTYRFKAVGTPVSTTRFRVSMTIYGEGTTSGAKRHTNPAWVIR